MAPTSNPYDNQNLNGGGGSGIHNAKTGRESNATAAKLLGLNNNFSTMNILGGVTPNESILMTTTLRN